MRSLRASVLGIAFTIAVIGAGCRRGPEVATVTTNEARVQAVAWKGESYHTRNGRSAITLISSDELEYRLADNTILLCKYTDQGQALRVIVTAFGTQQVQYFRRVQNGLVSNDGDIYLNAAGMTELQRQQELERQRELEAAAAQAKAQAAEEERLAAIARAEALRQEEARKKYEALVAEARSLVKPLGSIECIHREDGMGRHFLEVEVHTYRFTVTESSISRELIGLTALKGTTWSSPPDGSSETIWFDEVTAKPAVWRSPASIYEQYLSLKTAKGTKEWYCSGREKRAPPTEPGQLLELLESAVASWQTRFPSLARW